MRCWTNCSSRALPIRLITSGTRRLRRLGELLAELGVVGGFLLGVRQARLRRSQLIEDSLRQGLGLAQLVGPNVRHPLLGGIPNHFGVGFESIDPQQPIMVRRLFFGRNSQPAVIRVEFVCHSVLSAVLVAILCRARVQRAAIVHVLDNLLQAIGCRLGSPLEFGDKGAQ